MPKINNLVFLIGLAVLAGLAVSLYFNVLRPNNLSRMGQNFQEVPEVITVGPPELSGSQPAAAGFAEKTASGAAAELEEVTVMTSDFSTIIRDPFAPFIVEAPAAVNEQKIKFRFEGVWGRPGNWFALINNQILKEGDKIYNYEVKKIYQNRVIVSDGQNEISGTIEDDSGWGIGNFINNELLQNYENKNQKSDQSEASDD